MRDDSSIHISIRPSSTLTTVLLCTHAGAIGCLLALPQPGLVIALLSAVVLATLIRALMVESLLVAPNAIVAISTGADRPWRFTCRDGSVLVCPTLEVNYVHPLLICLGLPRPGRWPHSLVLLPDMVEARARRRLRRRLRRIEIPRA